MSLPLLAIRMRVSGLFLMHLVADEAVPQDEGVAASEGARGGGSGRRPMNAAAYG